jgi:hypothetical protein
MLEIIKGTPVYVWFIEAYLIWRGIHASKPHKTNWREFMIFPAIMITWALIASIDYYPVTLLTLLFLSLALGTLVGMRVFKKEKVVFHTIPKAIELSGSWFPLIACLMIFSLRYYLGVTHAIHPELKGSYFLLGIECLALLLCGLFVGRGVSIFQKYKAHQAALVD